jgi:hypothetical protein
MIHGQQNIKVTENFVDNIGMHCMFRNVSSKNRDI